MARERTLISGYYSKVGSKEKKLPLYINDLGRREAQETIHRPAGVPDYQILYCVSGKGVALIGDTEYTLARGQALILPPFSPHEYRAFSEDEPWGTMWVTYNGKVATQCFDFRPSIRELPKDAFESFYAAAARMSENEDFHRLSSPELYAVLMLCDFSPVVAEDSRPNVSGKAISRVVSYVSEHYSEPIELSRLAELAGLSEGHLCRLFKDYTHMRPIEFIIHLRTEQAKNLLLQFPSMAVRQVALSVGYSDPVYFTKLFKAKTGKTPGEFRREELQLKPFHN